MLQPEQFNLFNKRLEDKYGKIENLPNWRIVWSEDQLEKRWTNYTDEGLLLLNPEVRELPKYRQWIHEKYVLERLTAVPDFVESDLVTELSYEPIWIFEEPKNGNSIDPNWPAVIFVIENVLYSQEHIGYTKYKDPDSDPKESVERREARLKELEQQLFGNETETGDALAYREGVGYTKSVKEN